MWLPSGSAIENIGGAPPMAMIGVTISTPAAGSRSSSAWTSGVSPPIELPPGSAPARFRVALLMHDELGAAIAAPVVADRLTRLGSLRDPRLSFAELFPTRAVGIVPGTPIVTIDLAFKPDIAPRIWLALLLGRDLGFVAW